MNDYAIAGLPLHPLLVHLVVVLVPLAALAVVLHAVWPAAARRLGIVTPLAGLALVIVVPLTVNSGEALQEAVGLTPPIQHHADLGRLLLPWAIALFGIGLIEWVWTSLVLERSSIRTRKSLRILVRSIVAVAALAVAAVSVTLVVMIGEAGARAVWGGLGF